MLSTKEIAEKFDIPKTTLYGWKTDREKIYNYLASSDEQYEKHREITILLETYIKTIQTVSVFEYKELEYILSLELSVEGLQEVQNLHLHYVNASMKKEKSSSDFILLISKKLQELNLIEKYIFLKRAQTLREKIKGKKEEKEKLLKHYFKEFLSEV